MVSILRKTTVYVRWAIVGALLVVLVLGIIGFAEKWSETIFHPELVLERYRSVTEDIFAILVVYELLDLLRTLSPRRLMDVVMLVMARKIVLAPDHSYLIGDISAFAILLLVRLLWEKFSPPVEEHRN